MAAKQVSSLFSRVFAGGFGFFGFFGRRSGGGGELGGEARSSSVTSLSVALLAVVLMLAPQAWGQQTINVASPSGTGVTVSGTDITLVAGAANSIITGSAAGKRLIIDAAISVTFRNLTIIGDLYSAVSIGNGTARTVTINLEGVNTLTGGIGGAGLRVPTGSNLTINGPGSLTAIGGQWRSLIQSDAGAGIGGGNVANAGATNAGNRGDNCGTLTINGGTITAYGGGSGQGTDVGYACTYAAGIGGSGYRGTACDLTINGGNVTAISGRQSANNDIGPGIGYATCGTNAAPSGTGTYGTNVRTKINGGSVKATVWTSSTTTTTATVDTNMHVRTSYATATSVTMRTIKVGASTNAETQDKAVTACKFAGVDCNVTAAAAGNIYGIKDVKTDGDGQVYFWLRRAATGNITTADSITLNIPPAKTYGFVSGTTYTFQGPLPSMTVPTSSPNSYIGRTIGGIDGEGGTYTATGPYRTGFQMSGYNHVAAVGHKITLFKGEYIQNDAAVEASGGTRNHAVRWKRSSTCVISMSVCTGGTDFTPADAIMSSSKDSADYTPVAADYGQYIWAEVLVRDNGSRPATTPVDWSNAVVYPPIKVGVVIDTSFVKGLGIGDTEFEANKGLSLLYDGSSPAKGLITGLSNTNPWNITANAFGFSEVKYTWRAYLKGNSITTSIGTFSAYDDTTNVGLGSPITYSLPTPGGDTAVSGDIVLRVEVKDGSTPKLKKITICPNGVFPPDASCIVNSDPYNTVIGDKISKSGIIELEFERKVISPLGSVSLSTGGITTPLSLNSSAGDITFTYNYGQGTALTPGGIYSFSVTGFINEVNNKMANFQTSLTVERKASVAWHDDALDANDNYTLKGDTAFIVGKNIKGTFNYVANDGGAPVTTANNGFCYYWEITTAKPETEVFAPGLCTNTGTFNLDGTAYLGATSNLTLGTADFGKWVRLVVRPNGTNVIDGGPEGEPVFGTAKHIGVLLTAAKPSAVNYITKYGAVEGPKKGLNGYATAPDCWLSSAHETACPLYANVTFKGGCDPSNPDEGMVGCTSQGYIVYDQNDVRLGVTINDVKIWVSAQLESAAATKYFQSGGWYDDLSNDCGTAGVFSCGTMANYKLATIPATGIVVITPVVKEVHPPEIEHINLSSIGSVASVDLKAEDGQDSITVLSNMITLAFDVAVTFNTGTVKLSKGNTEVTLPGTGTCSDVGSGVSCNVNLPALDFNSSYKVVVSGFQNAETGDKMQTEQFNFISAPGPTLTVTATSSLTEGNAIGHIIYGGTSNYVANGGTAAGAHTYCWQRAAATSVAIACTGGMPATINYTPVTADYGQYIRLVVTPKDDGTPAPVRSGAMVASEWMQVGVLLTMGNITKNNALGTTHTAYIGATQFTNTAGTAFTSTAAGVVVYGTTSIRWSSDVPTDKIVKWTPSAGSVSTDAIFNYTPPTSLTSPAGDITFNLEVEDGDLPTIFASKNDPNIKLEFSKDVEPTGSLLLTIARPGGETWTCTSASAGPYDEIDIPYTCFTNLSGTYAVSSDVDTLKISAGAFVDASGNVTVGSNRLALLSNTSFYSVRLNRRSISKTATYGSYDSQLLDTALVVVTNEGSDPIDLEATLSPSSSSFVISGTNTCTNIPVSGTCTFKVAPANLQLNAGTHTVDLIIKGAKTGETKGDPETVSVTFVVSPKLLTIVTEANFDGVTPPAVATRVYDGTTDAPAVDPAWNINWGTNVSGVTLLDGALLKVTASGGSYSDGNVGNNKPVTITYTISGAKADNYTFVAGLSQLTTDRQKTGNITPLSVFVVLGAGADFGTKEYDGMDTLMHHDVTIGLGSYIPGDVLVLNADDIVIRLNSANVGERDISSITGLSLSGDAAINYQLMPLNPSDLLGKTATINPASLASLASEFTGASAVTATATYEDALSSYPYWVIPPASIKDVEKNGMPLSGTWRICSGAAGEPAACAPIPTGVGTPAAPAVAPTAVKAYFQPASTNYLKDLVVEVVLTVKPLAVTEIAADLSKVNEGVRQYDGTDSLAASKIFPATSSPLFDCLVANTAKYTKGNSSCNAKDACSGKMMEITWKSTGATGCAVIEANYDYSGVTTKISGGIIEKNQLHISGIQVADKDYDNTTAATFKTGSSGTLTPGALITAEGIALTVSPTPSARFVTSNVNMDVSGNVDFVSVILTASDYTLSGNASFVNTNYEVVVVGDYKAKINPVAFPDQGLALKQKGTYGSAISDIKISTALTAEYSWPSSLTGLNSTSMSGSWEWVGSRTLDVVTTGGQETCGGTHHTNTLARAAKFTPYSQNYLPYEADVSLCVVPYRLIAGAPMLHKNGIKVFDNTKVYDITDIDVNANWKASLPVSGDDTKVSVKISNAQYADSSASQDGSDYRPLTVSYELDKNIGDLYLPPVDFVYGNGMINQRTVTVAGLAPQNKYYDGDLAAVVDHSAATLSGVLPVHASDMSLYKKISNPLFNFNNANASEMLDGAYVPREITTLKGNFDMQGSANVIKNYKFEMPEMKAIIYKASFADFICPDLGHTQTQCNAMTPEQKQDMLNEHIAEVVDSAMSIMARGVTPINAIYGQTFSEFSDSISAALPSTLAALFSTSDPTAGSWSWESATNTRMLKKVGADTGFASFLHGNSNYEVLTGIPIPITVGKRPLDMTIIADGRPYDSTNVIVIPSKNITYNNKVNGDNIIVEIRGTVESPSAGEDKVVTITYIGWGSGLTSEIKASYELPKTLAVNSVTISKKLWTETSQPGPKPSKFIYDTLAYPNLAAIGLASGWSWVEPTTAPKDPHALANNPSNADSINARYSVQFTPKDPENYYTEPKDAILTIIKRGTDKTAKFDTVIADCGADTARVTVVTTDPNAYIWYDSVGVPGTRTFAWNGVHYGRDSILYEIQAQAYGDANRSQNYVYFNRMLPFANVVDAVRGKSFTISLDTTQLAEREFFNKYKWNYTATKWYKGKDSVGVGRNLAISLNHDDDYWVKLYTTTGEVFNSCKANGAPPDLVPVAQPSVRLVASSFTSKVVAGGTHLVVDTPFGSSISIYTMKGELVSRAQAVENRTVVKVPSTHGMYIVKLEAK